MSKASLYLNRIEIRDFRTFGCFELALPPGPGVTILWGANGLGKSNLFAALEWGLTSKVERLWQTKATAIERFAALRRDGTGDPCVKLSYTDGTVIERTSDSVTPEGFESRLTDEGWPAAEFATALRFTHLLGQSVDQHLVRMDDTQRWTYVGPITRLKEVWDIQRKLGGPFTRELNRFVEQATEAVASTKLERDRFLALRGQRDRLRDLARAAQAVSPEQAGVAVADIMRQLRTVYGLDWPVSSPRDATDLLADQGSAIQKSLEHHRSYRASIDLKHADIERNMKVIATIADLTARLQVNLAERESLSARGETLKANAAELANERAAAKKRHAEAAERFAQLNNLRELEQQLTEYIRQKEGILIKVADIRSRRQAITVEMEPTRVALAAAETAAHVASEANQRLGHAAVLAAQVQALEEAERDYLAMAWNWKQTSHRSAESSERITVLLDRANVLVTELAEVKARLKFVRHRADAIHGAVAMIAEAMNDDVCNCPVCLTTHKPGRLKELARAAAAIHSPHLAEMEAEVARREAEIARVSEERARLEEESKQLDRVRLASEQARGEFERQENRLKVEPEFAGAARDALPALAKEFLARAQNAADDAHARAQAAGDVKALRSILHERLEQIENLERPEAEARATAERAEASVRDVTSRIGAICNAVGLGSEWRTIFATTIELAVQAEDSSLTTLRKAEAKMSVVEGSLQEIAARLKEVEYVRGQLEAEVQARQAEATLIMDTWRRSGLKEPIGTESLQEAIEVAEKNLAELAAMKVRHEGLIAGLAAWSSAVELKRCEETIADWVLRKQCAGEDALIEALTENIRIKEKRCDALGEIDRQREQIRNTVKDQNRRIQETTLQPLNGLLNAFSSALVTLQSHEMRLDCRFGIGAGTGILAKDVRGNQVNPELYLSEGQLGAVNLALLFSANLTYPWSRWPALLIDDPLQYSDIISASAFMDLICNLVQERKLQVILSTHDSSEADFCRRKCVAAGIPTQNCQLLANSQDGVQYRTSW